MWSANKIQIPNVTPTFLENNDYTIIYQETELRADPHQSIIQCRKNKIKRAPEFVSDGNA